MKISTSLSRIKAQMDAHSQLMIDSMNELEKSYDVAVAKERLSLIKKFSKQYGIPIEDIEKKILPKKKRQQIAENIKKLEEMNRKQLPIFKKIIKDEQEYFYEDKHWGIVIQDLETVPKIVGYYDEKDEDIIFTNT
jgi:hypothetical protein